jgi:prepilin-type N-terminal cleavage/methylation domain-containing protein
MELKMRKKNKKYAGFSLLEMIIAVSIFVIVVLATAASFSNAFFSGQKTGIVLKNLENGRTAIETMAKNIRMSRKLVGITNGIKMFNNSQGKCIAYVFSGGKLQSVFYASSDAETDSTFPTCADPDMNNASDLISSGVSGSFSVVKTSIVSPKKIGKATILIKIGTGSDIQYIQTTVSFRDFRGVL